MPALQKTNFKAVISYIGLALHVPAIMALITLFLALLLEEPFALIPFLTIALSSFILGQLLYRCCFKERTSHIWDAMIIAAISWILCSVISAIPFYWIAKIQVAKGAATPALAVFTQPLNALFEATSGFTSTGLTLFQEVGDLPHILQWWRSFLQWIGGIGIIVFILSLTHLNKEGYQLYYAEAHTEQMKPNITKNVHWIWAIYFLYTLVGIILFFSLGMPLWEAINHSMTAISTGGFTIRQDGFAHYSTPIALASIFLMTMGAISFAVHYQVLFRKRWQLPFRDHQHRLLFILLILGSIAIYLITLIHHKNITWLDSIYQWTSALTTCGFYTLPIEIYSPIAKILLMVAMILGGTMGSTAGGIKLERLISLFEGLRLRILSLTYSKEKIITRRYHPHKAPRIKAPADINIPKTEKSANLFSANIFFSMWMFTLFLGWFFTMYWVPAHFALDALFDIISAMGNAGLSSGFITPNLPSGVKIIFIVIMGLGRLEIIPVIVLIIATPMSLIKNKRNNKKTPN